MGYTYPNTVYDVPENLLAVLGSFWSSTYLGRDQVADVVAAKALVEGQSALAVMELISALSRYEVPIFHRRNWYRLTLLESQRNTAATSLLRYGGGAVYGGAYQYGVPSRQVGHAFPAPAALASAELLMNRFTSPSLVWTRGIDFVREPGVLIFRANPFDDSRIAFRDVYKDGQVVDREAALWLFRGEFDWDAVYRQFGYVLKMRLRSSAGYRDLMNAVFDALVGGTTRQQVLAAFSAVTGIPLVREAVETVEDIWVDSLYRLVITDHHVYKFDREVTVTVVVGDTVHAGDSLVDALQFHELRRGDVPAGLTALTLGKGFLASCFYDDLIFEDKDVPLAVITDDPSGFTKLTWPLGGFPLDVERFFDEMHERGVAEALRPLADCEDTRKVSYPANDCGETGSYVRRATLAHLLDVRENPIGEPGPASLPRIINPLKFLIKNVLRNNACIVRVKASHMGRAGLGLHNVRYLQRVTPPHTAMILLVDVTAPGDSVTVSQVSEEVSTFTGMTPLADLVPGSLVLERRPRIRIVSGTCQ